MSRREKILELLKSYERPVTGSELAKHLGVSRQVIVQDVAILRASGQNILASPQGYLLLKQESPGYSRAVLAVKHGPEQTEEELNIMVDHGLKVIDVIVEHPIYGELRGYLMLASRNDVKQFIHRVQMNDAALLSTLTGGVHLHTVEYKNQSDLELARKALSQKGILAE